ncbi:MAG: hypothetical protein AAFV53_33840 [Myxococcota bacterium]
MPILKSILDRPKTAESIQAIIRFFDEDAPDNPEDLQEQWRLQAHTSVSTWRREAPDGTLKTRLHCLEIGLARWVPQPLSLPQVEALFSTLAPRLRGPPSPFQMLAFDIQLREMFLELGSPWLMEQFEIPQTLLRYFQLAQARHWSASDSPYALQLWGHDGVLRNTRSQCELFRWDRQRDDAEGPTEQTRPTSDFDDVLAALSEMTPRSASKRGTGAWLEIGSWSDKHTTELCCHRAGEWGSVSDYHDGHPWLNGHGWGDSEADSFLHYLIALAER